MRLTRSDLLAFRGAEWLVAQFREWLSRPLPSISAEHAPEVAEIIANLWGGEVEISAVAVAPEVPASSQASMGSGTDGGGAAKLDTPDSQGGKLAPGPRGEAISGKDGKAPLPKFSLAAYNGGPMRLAGWKFPVVIDAAGAVGAAATIPVYFGHPAENAPASEMMETLVGQTPVICKDGRITACGDITGGSRTVREMQSQAAKGFKFQNSVHGLPTQAEFVAEGSSAMVNGRLVCGPVVVARKSVLDHIAILPLGADTTTSASIAAAHAARESHMEFAAWLKANYGMDQAAFDALPDPGKATIKAAFDNAGKPAEKVDDTKPVIKAEADVAGDFIKAQNAAAADNEVRIAKISALAKDFPEIKAQAIRENWNFEHAENVVVKAQNEALTKSHFNVNTGRAAQGMAHHPRVLEAATLLSCGYAADRLLGDSRYGQQALNLTDDFFRNERTHVVTPSKLARIVARHNGVNLPDGHGDDFWSDALANERICPRGGERVMAAGYAPISAEFSSISFPVALSNVMNKFMLDGYTSVDPNHADPVNKTQAWKHFARVTSVQDFKPHYRVRMVASLLLQRLLKGGEIQHGTAGEQSYMLTADTKAIMLGLTRKDLINDDMSILSSLPTHFGIGSAQTVANDIYACLLTGYQSDGSTAFFTASAITIEGNKMGLNLTSGAALAYATLDAARIRFANQTQPNGQPAGLLAELLLIPPGLIGTAANLYKSSEVRDTTASTKYGTTNILAGMYRPVSSSYLANGAINSLTGATVSGSATTWYLSTPATAQAYPLEIGFLNGTEVPIIERAEADFNRLGISFRTFLDYGVALGEPRSMQKQTA
jgi:hypothetical protein